MEHTTTNVVTESIDGIAQQALHHAEDAINKLTAQYFGDEILPYLHIEGEIDHIGSTELTHLELKKYYQDFNYVMKDGSWTHLEFQSTDGGETDLRRFRAYEAVTSHQNDVDVKTYVLYSGNIQNPATELRTGFNTYCVRPIIMKGLRAEEVIPDIETIEAVIYAMANKFLTDVDMNEVKEAIKMSPLGTLIYNDGINEASIQNARNFFINGASFELVRNSITTLTDATLKEIYDEVMANKDK